MKQKVQGKRRSAFSRFIFLDVDNKLMSIICRYLHGPLSGLPGAEVWRLSLTSKMHYSIISTFYDMQALCSNRNKENVLEMLS